MTTSARHITPSLLSLNIFLPLFIIATTCFPQSFQPGFHHLTPSGGLSNASTRCITEDKYGFIWVGTMHGLNRYDGCHVIQYFSNRQISSVSSSIISSLYTDFKGRLWVGCDTGFCMFDDASASFIRYNSHGLGARKIVADKSGNIWVATSGGLKFADSIRHELVSVPRITDTVLKTLLQSGIRDISCGPDGQLCLATGYGVLQADPVTWKWKLFSDSGRGSISLPGNNVFVVSVDKQNRIWASVDQAYSTLCCISADRKRVQTFDHFKIYNGLSIPNFIRALYQDSRGKLWVGSTNLGLSLYNESQKSFTNFLHDPANPSSFATSSSSSIFEDSKGILWLGTEGEGLDFFHPGRQIFSVLRPGNSVNLLHEWARALAVDNKDRLWLATAFGVSVYKPGVAVIKNFVNADEGNPVLHSHSVRSLMYDENGYMWIGTATGLNRYDLRKETMRFYDSIEHMPKMFVHFIRKLRNGTILVGGSGGLFTYQPGTDHFFDLRKNSPLEKYARGAIKAFREDKNGYWWLGTYNRGVIVYDPSRSEIVKILNEDSSIRLCNNYIQCFREDAAGNMWIGTREGLVKYNLESNQSETFTQEHGLPNGWICGMLFDAKGRLWIGTDNGLCVMNPGGKITIRFGVSDGLSTTQFNDQEAYELNDGRFVFPSRKGFIFFNPLDYKWEQGFPSVYITGIQASGKNVVTNTNPESLQQLSLNPQQNFFTIVMNGIHFLKPEDIWYAYKLEGFDKEWIYSKNGLVNYTNVPGGNYVFKYKASTDPSNWNMAEKQLAVSIGTVFYKTGWFLLLVLLLLGWAAYSFFRSRFRRQHLILSLQTKAATLEKEKAQVQYDNLKQQLNPHFLFNSLSSLRSLIRMKHENATGFLDGLSQTYRYLLRSRDNDLVPLSEELNFLNSYMQLQQVRFDEGLELKINIEEKYLTRLVAPVTLQGLIENAIKHNTIDENSPLVISISVEEDDYVVVRNNLQRYMQVETSNKKGLAALKLLYSFYTHRQIMATEEGGYFVVRIPLL